MSDIPLGTERIVIVALLREVPLLPLAAVNERDIVLRELHQRIGFREVGNDRVRMRFGSRTTFAIRVLLQRLYTAGWHVLHAADPA